MEVSFLVSEVPLLGLPTVGSYSTALPGPGTGRTLTSKRKLLAFKGMSVDTLAGIPRSQENDPPLGPYGGPMPMALQRSQEGGDFVMSEVPLYRN